jgi:hypothetical protein
MTREILTHMCGLLDQTRPIVSETSVFHQETNGIYVLATLSSVVCANIRCNNILREIDIFRCAESSKQGNRHKLTLHDKRP